MSAARNSEAVVDIADLKAKVDIVDVVGRHTDLKKRGSDYWAKCPFHDDGTPSFKVSPQRQEYHCFGCGAHGDVLDFVMAAESVNLPEAIRLLQAAGGAERRPQGPRTQPAAPADDNRERAQEIWREAALRDWWPGSPAERYLHSRGITSRPQHVLRFHPECPFGDVGEDGRRILRRSPAIIAPVHCHRTHLVVAVWRVQLTPAGEKLGRYGLGPTKGNASRLFWPEDDEVAVAEGVEDALAFHELSGLPTWAALSAPFMADLVLPARLGRVTIAADRDANGAGLAGAGHLARRLQAEGRSVEIVLVRVGKDANDALLRRTAS